MERRYDIENNTIECIWLEIFQKNSKSFLVGMIYRHPNSTVKWNEDFEIIIEKVLQMDKELYLLGDFNRDLFNDQIKKHGCNIWTLWPQSKSK